jgi:hypothetical protein
MKKKEKYGNVDVTFTELPIKNSFEATICRI